MMAVDHVDAGGSIRVLRNVVFRNCPDVAGTPEGVPAVPSYSAGSGFVGADRISRYRCSSPLIHASTSNRPLSVRQTMWLLVGAGPCMFALCDPNPTRPAAINPANLNTPSAEYQCTPPSIL